MLNGEGGRVVFGVVPEGKLTGQEIGGNTIEQVASEIREISPVVVPDLEQVPVEADRFALVLTVPGGGGPYCYRRKPFLRLGPTTSEMPQELYELKIAEKLHGSTRWENQPCTKTVTLDDLDAEEIRQTVQTAQRLGRLGAIATTNIEEILVGLDLMVGGRLINAAIALYAHPNRPLYAQFPQLSVRLGRFRGNSRLAEFADNRDYRGGIFALLRHAERFLADHVRIAGRVVPGKMQREDFPAYPPRATREALTNAFCHRDYTMAGGAVEIAMYDDHLEITNPGEFHFGITSEKLKIPHASRPWNPLIASVLHRAGVIERWGSGALNIVSWCREGRAPDPSWYERARTVSVTFLPVGSAISEHKSSGKGSEKSSGKGSEKSSGKSSDFNRKSSEKGSGKGSEKSSGKGSEKSSGKILAYLCEHPVATIAELAEVLGISARAVEKLLRRLRKNGRLQRIGPDKGGSWQVIVSLRPSSGLHSNASKSSDKNS